MTVPKMTAAEVIAALRIHYPEDAWALIEQVGNGTGYAANRHIDAIAMGLWPSRGLELHAIEVKVSRGDFRRELAQPEKAEAIASRCDRFWIAAPAGLIDLWQLSTAAPKWGLLEVEERADGRRIRTAKPAEQLEAEPLDRSFLAAILRQAQKASPTKTARAELEALVRRELEDEYAGQVERAVERARTAGEVLRGRVEDFERESGIDLSGSSDEWKWLRTARIGAVVRLLAADGWEAPLRQLSTIAKSARNDARRIEKIADELERVVADVDVDEEAR